MLFRIEQRLLVFIINCFFMTYAFAAADKPFIVTDITSFDEPWALAFLPDGRLLVTEKKGKLLIVSQDGKKIGPVSGVPEVDYGGQGGFGDVMPHPNFENNNVIYLSYVEAGQDNKRGAAVIKAQLVINSEGGALSDIEVIWRQNPKVTGRGHYGHRLIFSDNGYLFISSGDRQKFDPAQNMKANLGKIIRLHDDGSIPSDNPFIEHGGITSQIWSLGHRNPLGIAFDEDGQLWNIEMGPEGGDELNRVVRGENYGYPIVSNGDHYDGRDIPDHPTRPEFTPPKTWWTPVISPSAFIIYSGDLFANWKGMGFITGLSSESLVRIEFNGENAHEAERFDMGGRIRSIRQGPNGGIWILEDGRNSNKSRLLKLVPRQEKSIH